MTHEMASMVKAWTTLRGREVAALGRELLGGNGIVSDFLVAKAFCDLEAYYTYAMPPISCRAEFAVDSLRVFMQGVNGGLE